MLAINNGTVNVLCYCNYKIITINKNNKINSYYWSIVEVIPGYKVYIFL